MTLTPPVGHLDVATKSVGGVIKVEDAIVEYAE